jgi:hypothetical protein
MCVQMLFNFICLDLRGYCSRQWSFLIFSLVIESTVRRTGFVYVYFSIIFVIRCVYCNVNHSITEMHDEHLNLFADVYVVFIE